MLGMDCSCYTWGLLALGLFVLYKWLDNVVRRPRIDSIPSRYIFITGCGRGFGNSAAKRFDAMGCHVFAGCLSEKGAEELRKACSSRLHTVPLDVSKHDSVVKAAEYVKQHLPKNTDLWAVINNAAIAHVLAPAELLPLETYVNIFNVNCLGYVDVVKTFLPLMGKSGGRIVNVASIIGRNTMALMSPYAIAKFGVEAFSDSIRRELLSFGVTVHLIEPGTHKTGFLDSRRDGEESIALWRKQSPELQAKWEKIIKNFVNALPKFDRNCPGVEPVIDAFEHALFSQRPRSRYLVGWDAKLLVGLSRLPEYIGDRLIMFLLK